MRVRVLLATILLCAWTVNLPMHAGTPQGAAAVSVEKNTIPRMADGRPDFQGRWTGGGSDGRGGTTMRRSYFLDGHLGDRNVPEKLPSWVIDPTDGKIPYKTWALAKVDELWQDYIDPFAACTSPGTVRQIVGGPRGFQVFQTQTRLAIVNEWGHVYRVIPLDGTSHIPSSIRLFMGDSRGRWDGDTLVVTTKNFNGKTWLTLNGDFHSERAEAVERWRHTGADALRYEVTVTDPYVYTRPWTMAIELRRFEDPDDETWEEECHAGNVDFPHMRQLYKGFFGISK